MLTLSPQVWLGVHPVLVDGVDVVFGRLERPQLRAQVAVLAAVRASGACETEGLCETGGHGGGSAAGKTIYLVRKTSERQKLRNKLSK